MSDNYLDLIMMNDESSERAAASIAHALDCMTAAWETAAAEVGDLARLTGRPSRTMPISMDFEGGRWWCSFSGMSAGGGTPEQAADNFDNLWNNGKI